MVKHAPGINDVERAKGQQVILIKHRSLFDAPIFILGEKPALEFSCAGDGLWVVVKGVNLRSQSPRCQAEQTAAGANIKKALPLQIGSAQHFRERAFGFIYPLFIKYREETTPIL